MYHSIFIYVALFTLFSIASFAGLYGDFLHGQHQRLDEVQDTKIRTLFSLTVVFVVFKM